MASANLPLRYSAFPESRSLVTLAVRLGLTGTGGGGAPEGVSRLRRERCSLLRASSSEARARDDLVAEMAFD